MQGFRGAIGESGRPYRYDVFLSFRGEDTRKGFAGHLHAALDQRGIAAFMDDEELREGEEIGPAILGAIGESRISIVVFSENYASSSWCLDELAKIVECRDAMGQIVRPVFYKVDPSEVRNQRGRYGRAVIDHEERLKSKGDSEKVKRWREALAKAANISGRHLVDERESTVIQSIVKGVWAQLDRDQLHIPKNVVAMDLHVDCMRTLLDMESNEVRMVGICGFGGIGKTTIAKATYNAFAHKFDCCGFLSNVRETCEKFRDVDLLQLQEALISQVTWDDDLKLGNVDRGMNMIKSRLCKKKVLIVIDDVNQLIQLETLVGGRDWFGCGSRIILTTRDEHLLAAHGVESIYKVQPLDDITARRLFCSIVFQNFCPPPNYEELSYSVVNYTKGLPLAIKVLGSSLRGRSFSQWENALEKLKSVLHGDIFSVLRISFDDLDAYEQDIFLDIACFFKGENKSYVREILKSCDLYPDAGIDVLIDKSLISIEHGKLEMHDMIQEMGREIVRRDSPNEPGERSRLWSYEDVLQVLTEGTGTNKVQAIMLKLAAPEEVCFSAQAFTNMRGLRFFLARNVHHLGYPIYFPAGLRWLEWPGYSPPSVPFNTVHTRLVGLDLSKSSIRILGEEFKRREILALPPNITSLHAKGCESLETCVDLSHMLRYNPDESPWLRRIDFSGCHKLIQDQCSSNCNMLSIEGLLGEARIDVFHPGSRIPKWFVHQSTWFVHQSTRGLIRFPVSSELYCDIAGLAFCAIVSSANRREASISCEIQLFVNHQETYGCVDCFPLLESDHIWLLYVPRRTMWGLDAKLLNHSSQFTVLFQASKGTLRSCGVHLVYKQGKQRNGTKIDKSVDSLNSNKDLTSSHV